MPNNIIRLSKDFIKPMSLNELASRVENLSTKISKINITSLSSISATGFCYDENGNYILPDKLSITERLDGFGFKKAKVLKDWENNLDSISYPVVAEQKLDGIRCQIILALNKTKTAIKAYAYTRNGNRIKSIYHIIEELESAIDIESAIKHIFFNDYYYYVLDGELQFDSLTAPFRIVNGLANRDNTDEETRSLRFFCYNQYYLSRNFMPLSQVNKKSSRINFAYLGYENNQFSKRLGYSIIETPSQLKALAEIYKHDKAEGLIIKRIDESIANNRSSDWLKIKFKKRKTFRLIEVIEGDGKCYGTCGAIVVQDSKGHTSKIGTGFTDLERDELYSLRNECHSSLILIECEYLALTGGSLREASYLGIRRDIVPTESAIDEFEDRG